MNGHWNMEHHPVGTVLSIVLGATAGWVTAAEVGHTVVLAAIGGAVGWAVHKILNTIFKHKHKFKIRK